MPAEASHHPSPAPQLLFDQAAQAGTRRGGRPGAEPWQWHSLFAAAGFALGDDELDADDDTPDLEPTVQRQISAAAAPPLPAARHAPAFVFDLAQRPVVLRSPLRSTVRSTSTVDGTRLTRCIVRAVGVTRCTLVPLAETAEWAEREQARRARQRPPRSGTRKIKKAIARWGLFDGSQE